MRLFDEGTSWEQARKDTRYPTARLDARKHHAALSRPLRALLAQWNTADQERRDADDAVVDANALVSAIDEELDDAIGLLVARLLYEAGNDPANATFKTYFLGARRWVRESRTILLRHSSRRGWERVRFADPRKMMHAGN